MKVLNRLLLAFIVFLFMLPVATGQPTLSFDLKKPKKYVDRQLRSEKTGEKKFTFPRKAYQNTVTHYNWYFNASNRLNQVLERARAYHRDDYSQLLSFYNYSLDITSKDSMELDSVIYKSNAGILIHDLRNSWIDNLYMLLGKAYFYKNELDSAYLAFQYINFAFAPKEKDGYDIPIGSNVEGGGSALSISTKEKNSLLKKAVSTPPSRNESFIWQIKTFLEQNELSDAAVLIQTLKKDPNFPGRLQTDLHEVEAYYFYKLQNYDSAAHYLSMSLENASDKYELSRWEYLIGQLYERSGKPDLAAEYFNRAIKHSLDPVLEVFARLNSIRQNKGDDLAMQKAIAQLSVMGKRDRYSRYRDIIFFTAAQIELERNNIPGAKAFLLKSAMAARQEDINSQRARAYLLLGDLSFEERKYQDAKSYYDSISSTDPVIPDQVAFESRLNTLSQITTYAAVISRQDSLQALAAMPEAEREVLLKKTLKLLRKQRGIKDEDSRTPNNNALINSSKNPPLPDLFQSNEKGEWYFHNPALKSKGYTAFIAKWGNRPNVDNWRRSAAINENAGLPTETVEQGNAAVNDLAGELSMESLLAGLPLTEEKLALSNDSIENAKVDLAKAFFNGFEDYHEVINILDSFPGLYPESKRLPEALYLLYVSHLKTGDNDRAKNLLDQMQGRFAGDPLERKMTISVNGAAVENEKVEMTRLYEKIYNLFIEGNFEEAIKEKNQADERYGQNYWTPQLLYIQSIYFIRQRQDNEAKATLRSLIDLFQNSPMAEKATNLLDVLSRRREIEDYLTRLQITRPGEEEDSIQQSVAQEQPAQPVVKPEQVTVPPGDSSLVINKPITEERKPDTLAQKVNPPVVVQKPVVQQPAPDTASRPAPIVKNVPADKQETRQEPLPSNVKEKPTVSNKPAQVKTDTVQLGKTIEVPKTYSHNPDLPHYVVMVTNKVDPVYITESRNAFNRYNQQRHQGLEALNQPLDNELKFLVISGFNNASEAQQYAKEVKAVAGSQIIPWLPAPKYFFIVISNSNYELLMQTKTLEEYKAFEAQFFKE